MLTAAQRRRAAIARHVPGDGAIAVAEGFDLAAPRPRRRRRCRAGTPAAATPDRRRPHSRNGHRSVFMGTLAATHGLSGMSNCRRPRQLVSILRRYPQALLCQARGRWVSCKSLKFKIYAESDVHSGRPTDVRIAAFLAMRSSPAAGVASAARSPPRWRAPARRSPCSAAIARRWMRPSPPARRISPSWPMSPIRPRSAPPLRKPQPGSRSIS